MGYNVSFVGGDIFVAGSKVECFAKEILANGRIEFFDIKANEVRVLFSLSALNQSITDAVFFHWLKLHLRAMVLLMRSRIVLLTLPISDLVGLISLQVGLLAKLGLWSLSVMNASLLAVASTLSSMPSLVAIFLFSVRMARVVSGLARSPVTAYNLALFTKPQ